MTHTVDTVSALVQRIHILLAEQSPGQRLIIAIAGAPGAGKSTTAEQICHLLNRPEGPEAVARTRMPAGFVASDRPLDALESSADRVGPGAASRGVHDRAVVVPMDGFHLDNAVLRERDLLPLKGSPQTFDVDGFVALLHRLSVPDGRDVYIPVFDRAADLSRNAAQCVTEHHSVIIVEGNYLLLGRKGWNRLASLFHLSIMLDVPLDILEERLIERWLKHGLDPEAARERALSNDIPNAQVVTEESTGAHLYFKSVRQ